MLIIVIANDERWEVLIVDIDFVRYTDSWCERRYSLLGTVRRVTER